MPPGVNPSAARQAQKAHADTIEDLKQKNAKLTSTVAELEEGLEEATKSNKSLTKQISELVSNYKDIVDQLGDISDQLGDLQGFKSRATRLLNALAAGRNMDEVQNEVLTAAIASGDAGTYLDMLDSLEPISNGDENEGNNAPGAPDGRPGDAVMVGEPAAQPRAPAFGGGGDGAAVDQDQIDKLKTFKDAVNSCLFHLFGVVGGHLKPEHLVYPHGLTPDSPDWPGEDEQEGGVVRRRPYIRFDFSKPYDDPINIESFKQWVKYVRNRGGERLAAAAPHIDQATDETIQQRCITKFNYEADKFKRDLKAQAEALDAAQRAENPREDSADHDTADDGVVRPANQKKKRTATYRSRAEGKLKSRVRRIAQLPADTTYTEREKETFLTPGAMSLDETEYERDAGGDVRKTGRFITRAWPFLTDRFVALKTDVMAIPDPEPPRGYQQRVAGPPREGAPPRNKLNKYLLFNWMVKPEVLAENQEWFRTRRVIPDTDLIEGGSGTAKKRKLSSSGVAPTTKSDLRNVRKKKDDAKTHLIANLGGKTFDQLREELGGEGDDEDEGQNGGHEGSGSDGE